MALPLTLCREHTAAFCGALLGPQSTCHRTPGPGQAVRVLIWGAGGTIKLSENYCGALRLSILLQEGTGQLLESR